MNRTVCKVSCVLFLLLSVLLSGCNPQVSDAPPAPSREDSSSALPASQEDAPVLSVVTTIFPAYDFAREVAGDLPVSLSMLLPPGSESHSFEPSPQDLMAIQDCDLFIYNGGESETWVDTILSAMDPSDMRCIRMMDLADTVTETLPEGAEETPDAETDLPRLSSEAEALTQGSYALKSFAREEEADFASEGSAPEASDAGPSDPGPSDPAAKEVYDEHVWTAPLNAEKIVRGIGEAFAQADPVHADAYEANTEAYCLALTQLDLRFRQITDHPKRRTMVFGDRFPFRYFADAYDLSYYAAFPGCSTNSDPSAATLAFLIDKVQTEKIPVVFYMEFSNQRVADRIVEAGSAKKSLFHSCHTVSAEDMASGVSYLSLMEGNAQRLEEALNL